MNTITSSELRRTLKGVLSAMKARAEPLIIMQYSRPVAVLLDVDAFERLRNQSTNLHPRIARHPTISRGEPVDTGTRIPVREIVERTRADQSVEEIASALPPLTEALVHDALSYYFEHRDEIDRLIDESDPRRVLEAAGLEIEPLGSRVGRAARRSVR